MWIRLEVTAPADYERGNTEMKYENATVGNGYSRIVNQINSKSALNAYIRAILTTPITIILVISIIKFASQ